MRRGHCWAPRNESLDSRDSLETQNLDSSIFGCTWERRLLHWRFIFDEEKLTQRTRCTCSVNSTDLPSCIKRDLKSSQHFHGLTDHRYKEGVKMKGNSKEQMGLGEEGLTVFCCWKGSIFWLSTSHKNREHICSVKYPVDWTIEWHWT